MSAIDDAWKLVLARGPVDADKLFAAVATQEVLNSSDARTQLLARDALQGLRSYWGLVVLGAKARAKGTLFEVVPFLRLAVDEIAFPALGANLMTPTNPQQMFEFFRDLGGHLHDAANLTVGGSMALMVEHIISRHTGDIDVVDGLPDVIRREHQLLEQLTLRYRLQLTHFQSHYLPNEWEKRTASLGQFGRLSVRIVDPIDILTGKLFSKRTKDLDDVRLAMPKIDGEAFRRRIATATTAFRRDGGLVEAARRNWYIITGEDDLPPSSV